MNDRNFQKLVRSIARTCPRKRAQWLARQPPLLASLDAADAEDGPNPEDVTSGPQTRSQTPPNAS